VPGIGFDVRRQELQGHGLAELEIVGTIDLAHAALAEQAEHAEAAAHDLPRQVAGVTGDAERRPGNDRRPLMRRDLRHGGDRLESGLAEAGAAGTAEALRRRAWCAAGTALKTRHADGADYRRKRWPPRGRNPLSRRV
jgi:hypothetical protein